MRALLVPFLLVLLCPFTTSGQELEVPPGYTLYDVVRRQSVPFPPIVMKIEGGSVTTPEDGEPFYTITDGSVDGDRIVLELTWDAGRPTPTTATYLGRLDGEVLRGYLLMVGGQRLAVAISMAPASDRPSVEWARRIPPETFDRAPGISRIEILPSGVEVRAGESRRLVARAFDEAGAEIPDPEVGWFVEQGNATISAEGVLEAHEPGEIRVFARVGGALASAPVALTRPRVTELQAEGEIPTRLAVGSRIRPAFQGMTVTRHWDFDPPSEIASSDPSVVTVEEGSLVAERPGRAVVTVTADQAVRTWEIEVVEARGELEVLGTPEGPVRTGDVVRLAVSIPDARPIWTTGPDAEVHADGAFVAHRPGRHTVVATLGENSVTAEIAVEPRHSGGRIHILGHGLNSELSTTDLWPQNGYVYVGTTQANQLRTYDVSDPTTPTLTDSQAFDARVVNDVKVSPDGEWLVATREGASERRNGILVFSLADPSRPELVSEYTETLTGGVHNVFWAGDLVYAVNDGTGDLHVLDLSDPTAPREVGRWGLDVPEGQRKYLHDVSVKDGVVYLSYWMHGLVILDAGSAGMGGTPTALVEVSRIVYPAGPTHTAMRYGDYVFVGDEDWSVWETVPEVVGVDPRGAVHVIDVSDLTRPRYVARYEVPEAGAHNLWIDDGILYLANYQGGIRVVDVRGELRGDLYRQGREIAHYKPSAGPAEASRPFSPMVWGVFPMFANGWRPVGDVLYASDQNSGLWSFRVEMPEALEQVD